MEMPEEVRLAPEVEVLIEAAAAAEPGFFLVQIGANDGVSHDPIHHLVVAHRWSGVLVEPVRYLFERLVANYAGQPGLEFANVAIAETSGRRTLHRLEAGHDHLPSWYEQLGSFREEVVLEHAFQIPGIARYLVSEEVECITFSELVARHEITRIDLLHLDLEGYDGAILRSLDFELVRPRMILYEHCHLEPDDDHACAELLEGHGYHLIRGLRDSFAY